MGLEAGNGRGGRSGMSGKHPADFPNGSIPEGVGADRAKNKPVDEELVARITRKVIEELNK